MGALVFIPDKCGGCRRCILHRSFRHHKTHAPSKSRIYVVCRSVRVYDLMELLGMGIGL